MQFLNTYIRYQYKYLGIASGEKCPRCDGYIGSYINQCSGFTVEHCEKCHFIYHKEKDGKKVKIDSAVFFFKKFEDFPEEYYY